MKDLQVLPVLSEKVYGQSQQHNRFAFIVPKSANKHTVARAVAEQYEVDVVSVTIVNRVGKAVRTYRNKRFTAGSRSDSKKAYVTIKAGQSLPIFASVEDSEEKPAKADKKAESTKSNVKTTVKTASKTPVAKRIFSRKSGEK